jgi:anti-sigma factor RsiW
MVETNNRRLLEVPADNRATTDPSAVHGHPYEDDVPAFVLGALDAEEACQVNAHLAICPCCRAEAAAYQAVVDLLRYAIRSQDPPVHLRYRILARIAACAEAGATTAS